ncbi:unnamed protein product [Darwinula stevensoni]|uniref:Uncharacterized protein n=1 Tax=Darwinula stevensoni TaxID=69355 RepID=A0A7R9AEF2_9CRUS|nr:unnamed protein product [Darwinula stevensoni]CAG0902316.1 unnamed protein product [Darwinula stevensoni]
MTHRAAQCQGQCSFGEEDYAVIEGEEEEGGRRERGSSCRSSAMDLVAPSSPHRKLWCELPEVRDSGILDGMSHGERKLQEAIFEVITSEASYLKSLNVLVRHFVQCPQFSDDSRPDCVLSRRDRHILFSNIVPVRDASERLLGDLEERWGMDVYIKDICDIIYKHASHHFSVYVKYCSNQIYQDRLLNELKGNCGSFLEVLRELESDGVCQSLSMHSFLMLPMQRITRLPLLVDAIFHRLHPDSPEFHNAKMALTALNKVVRECNEGARKMERMEEMLLLSRQLDFGGCKAVPLISASRWLVKKGELTRLLWKETDTYRRSHRRPHKQTLHLFLFTDLLVVTKKKSGEEASGTFTVLDHCPRNMVQVQEVEEYRTRWIQAMTPRISVNPNEVIYEEWDCPQMQAVHPYQAQQSDELSLDISDVVNVLKKTPDGWYQGERIRDGERGWFPGNFCEEIASAHVRARNLRQRNRLLILSDTFIQDRQRVNVKTDRRPRPRIDIGSSNDPKSLTTSS